MDTVTVDAVESMLVAISECVRKSAEAGREIHHIEILKRLYEKLLEYDNVGENSEKVLVDGHLLGIPVKVRKDGIIGIRLHSTGESGGRSYVIVKLNSNLNSMAL